MAVITLTSDNFDETIHTKELVVVDFWAKWCGPCLAFAPIFNKVSERFPEIVFAQLDIEMAPDLASDFNIRSIPMLMIFKQEVAVFAEAGIHTAESLSELVLSAKALDMSQVLAEINKIKTEEDEK